MGGLGGRGSWREGGEAEGRGWVGRGCWVGVWRGDGVERGFGGEGGGVWWVGREIMGGGDSGGRREVWGGGGEGGEACIGGWKVGLMV